MFSSMGCMKRIVESTVHEVMKTTAMPLVGFFEIATLAQAYRVQYDSLPTDTAELFCSCEFEDTLWLGTHDSTGNEKYMTQSSCDTLRSILRKRLPNLYLTTSHDSCVHFTLDSEGIQNGPVFVRISQCTKPSTDTIESLHHNEKIRKQKEKLKKQAREALEKAKKDLNQ